MNKALIQSVIFHTMSFIWKTIIIFRYIFLIIRIIYLIVQRGDKHNDPHIVNFKSRTNAYPKNTHRYIFFLGVIEDRRYQRYLLGYPLYLYDIRDITDHRALLIIIYVCVEARRSEVLWWYIRNRVILGNDYVLVCGGDYEFINLVSLILARRIWIRLNSVMAAADDSLTIRSSPTA